MRGSCKICSSDTQVDILKSNLAKADGEIEELDRLLEHTRKVSGVGEGCTYTHTHGCSFLLHALDAARQPPTSGLLQSSAGIAAGVGGWRECIHKSLADMTREGTVCI